MENKYNTTGHNRDKNQTSPADHDNTEQINAIVRIKRQLESKLLILTHHYQRKEIVDLGDYRGDSFALSKNAAENRDAEYIVFCGVHFMAESAAILARPNQIVQIPDVEAGCWMADMIDIEQIEMAWDALSEITGPDVIMPIVYVNSDAKIKAFCGRHGGTTCTSSNAGKAFQWGFKSRRKILFLPDQHLGRNTGNAMGIDPSEMIAWDPDKHLGGNTRQSIQTAKLILWEGHCLVHTRFQPDQIQAVRQAHPEAKIVVHPECTEDVVALADAVGSTSFIVKYVEEAKPGEMIVIGTE
ncbi:MAG: quinolinate synthase NadA, partial [Spirochaetales bacterium]|nr:quinolinate synthase NadA [Spirochaetales bacterium]